MKSISRYTTVFFDLDDTIWDTAANARACLIDLYTQFNINKYFSDFNVFYLIYTANNKRLWKLYSKHEINKDTLNEERFAAPFSQFTDITKKSLGEMNDYYLSHICTKEQTIDGTFELLDYLKSKYKLYIISNGFTELQFKKIDSARLTPYFEKVILSDKVGVNKPHPDIFAYALHQANASNKESIMIGDNLYADIEGAAKSAIDQIWYNPEKSLYGDLKPTYIVDQLSDITNIL